MPEYQYAESNTHPEVPVLGARDELNIQKIPEYIRRMDIYVKNIDKNYKIHEGPSPRQLMYHILERLNYLPKNFLISVKIILMSHKTFQLKSRRIYISALEESLYAQVVMICRKILVQKGGKVKTYNKIIGSRIV